MELEIEHKYLVDKDIWSQQTPEQSIEIKQFYIVVQDRKVVRVRQRGDVGYLTIKNALSLSVKQEYEYEIPLQDVQSIIDDFGWPVIDKTRHIIDYKGMIREVDEFHGNNDWLITAEIELISENQSYEAPPRAIKNLTWDRRYTNSYLAEHPYTTRDI
mgnify:CR=1 FL=1